MFDWDTLLLSILGSGVTSAGVATGFTKYVGQRWMARYKAKLDQELEAYKDTLERRRKRIEAELGHRTYVGKAQFDCEYHALKDCFADIGKLRLSFNGLRPMMDRIPVDEHERTHLMVRRITQFKELYNPAVNTTASVYPFVPEDIYEQFEKCLKAALLEILHVEDDISSALSPSGCTDGAKNLGNFNSAYFAAAGLARQRFHELSVVSD